MAVFSCPAQAAADEAIVLRLDGAIGPAAASYIADGLQEAKLANSELVVIMMDTPGGLDTSMREIIRAIIASPVPVVTYVHPSGSRAASAGTYILYASHFAAMAPGTNLGAATPIQIGAVPAPAPEESEEGDGDNTSTNVADRKAINDAAAYIRSLAEMRGRNADWAEEAVRGAASLSADAALERGVIDFVATNLRALLDQLDGRSITVDGGTRQIETSGISIREVEPSVLNQILATITNPNIALLLLMIGVYGLIFEFLNPGALVPGTVGAISLLIGMYALAVLPVDYVGIGLIVLGIGLMVAEAFAPSFGALGIGGIASFTFGAAMMFDTDMPAFQVNWSVIAAVAVFSAGFVILVARAGLKSFRHRIVSGAEELIGAKATVLDWQNGRGHVFVHSERWNADGPEGLGDGDTVIIDKVTGLRLGVSRSENAHT
ncbi:NfeD family protein [Erythrobacter insulae]|nr:nodulation protein NfeD [Erythrobacter insulae]